MTVGRGRSQPMPPTGKVLSTPAPASWIPGEVRVERGVVVGLTDRPGGKRCGTLAAVGTPTRDRAIVDETPWNRMVVGEPVQLRVVDGPLGRLITADRIDLEERHHGG